MTKTQSKYQPLEKYLANKGFSQVPMTFSNIESIIEKNLPPSARKHRAWWSNNPSNSVITFAWLNAGYKTAQVDLENENLVFIRDITTQRTPSPSEASGRNPVFGCMENSVTIAKGHDLTKPVEPEWGDIAQNAQLPK